MKKWGQGFRPAAELLLGVPWLLASLASSQTTNEVTLTGKITDAITHQPIAGANVTRCCPRVNGSTNADGVYMLSVKPGQPELSINITKNGYAAIHETVSQKLDFELKPAAHIAGRLLDRETGEPLAGFKVMARTHNGEEWFLYSSGPSAADGSFAIPSDLSPANYVIEVDPPSLGRIVTGKPRPDEPGYGSTWFPGVPLEDMAVPVALTSGGTRYIELRLQKRDLYHVAGVIEVPEGRENEEITVSVTVDRSARLGEGVKLKAGPFRMEGIDEGSYAVFATTGTGASLVQAIEVGSRSIDDLKLTLRNDVKVRAAVHVKEDGVALPKHLEFFPFPTVFGEFVTEPTDLLVAEGLPAGRYWPTLITSPGFAVISISYGGRPVDRAPVDFEAQDSTVDFVITSRPAALTGTVRDANQKPVPEAMVSLAPDDPLKRLRTKTDANGAFRIGDLAPGKYKAFVEGGSAETVDLDFGQTANVELHVK